jgi:hypothetical protein
MHGFRG